jgi:hypothetical protein
MSTALNKNSSSPLRLHIDLDRYGTGEFEDSQSAIARPWRRLFQDGIDPGKIYYLIVNPSQTASSRALGSFCETTGGRLIFFPGCQGRQLNSRFTRHKPRTPESLTGIVDHITFEIVSRKGHITEVLQNGDRRVALKLPSRPEVASGLYAWFGITLRSLAKLDSIPGRLWFSAECSASDVERRLELFRKAGQASRVYELKVPKIAAHSFTQINFFVDLDATQRRNTFRTFLPKGPPELRKSIEVPPRMAAQIQSLQLDASPGMIRIHPIVWEGDPVVDVAFGF